MSAVIFIFLEALIVIVPVLAMVLIKILRTIVDLTFKLIALPFKRIKLPKAISKNKLWESICKFFGDVGKPYAYAGRFNFFIGWLLTTIFLSGIMALIYFKIYEPLTPHLVKINHVNNSVSLTEIPFTDAMIKLLIITGFLYVYTIVPYIALIIRRLRTAGLGLGFLFLYFAPFGSIIITILCFGAPDKNKSEEEARYYQSYTNNQDDEDEQFEDFYEKNNQNTYNEAVPTPYEILGIDSQDDFETMKKIHKGLVKAYHPDINDSIVANKKIKAINEAWEKIQKIHGKSEK